MAHILYKKFWLYPYLYHKQYAAAVQRWCSYWWIDSWRTSRSSCTAAACPVRCMYCSIQTLICFASQSTERRRKKIPPLATTSQKVAIILFPIPVASPNLNDERYLDFFFVFRLSSKYVNLRSNHAPKNVTTVLCVKYLESFWLTVANCPGFFEPACISCCGGAVGGSPCGQ